MCLKAVGRDQLVSEKDIVCYKIMRYNEHDDSYYTPYRGFYVNKDIMMGNITFRDVAHERISHIHYCSSRYNYEVTSGFIHAYCDAIDAERVAAELNYGQMSKISKPYEVFKCVIPAGTRYMKSFNGLEICAKGLKFVEQLYP